jgi:hypothetical protein
VLKLIKSDHLDVTAELIDEEPTPQAELDRFELQVLALVYVTGLLTPIMFYGCWWLILRGASR